MGLIDYWGLSCDMGIVLQLKSPPTPVKVTRSRLLRSPARSNSISLRARTGPGCVSVDVTLTSADVSDTEETKATSSSNTEYRVSILEVTGTTPHRERCERPGAELPGVECAVDASVLVAILLGIAAVVTPIFRGNGLGEVSRAIADVRIRRHRYKFLRDIRKSGSTLDLFIAAAATYEEKHEPPEDPSTPP
jgi:hypothetical protein